jgi:hypothetical protein
MKKWIILGAVLLAFTSCEKADREDFEPNSCTSNCVFIEGVIKDAVTGEPLKGVKLTNIFNYVADFPCLFCYEKTIDKYTSNSDGYFNFNFSVDSFHVSDSYFRITLEKENYFSKEIIVDRDVILDSVYDASTYLVPKSELTLIIEDRMKLEELDEPGYKFSIETGSLLKVKNGCKLVHDTYYPYGINLSYGLEQPSLVLKSYDVPSSCLITFTLTWWDHSQKKTIALEEDTFRIRKFGKLLKRYVWKDPN